MPQPDAPPPPPAERRAFFDEHREEATRLLLGLAAEWHGDDELWHDLGFSRKGEEFAADWCRQQWCSADWSQLPLPGAWRLSAQAHNAAVVASQWFGALGLRLEVFALSDAWRLLRLVDIQTRERERGGRPKRDTPMVAKQSRIGSEEASADEQDVADEQVAEDYKTYRRDDAFDSATVLVYAKHLASALHRFGLATHRALEATWFAHHDSLVDLLARFAAAAGIGWDVGGAAALPPDYQFAAPPDQNKVRALTAFRFLVFRDGLADGASDLGAAAFRATYLASLGKPTWAQLPKDRWDVVPKRVVADQLRQRFPQASPNVVADEARTRLATFMLDAMKLYRRRANKHDGGFANLADIIHGRDSVTATLRHELPRNSGVGPSAEAIERWRGDLEAVASSIVEAGT